MEHERITAADVRVGDRVAKSRTAPFERVEAVQTNAASVWLELENLGAYGVAGSTYRIRPGLSVKLWRQVAEG